MPPSKKSTPSRNAKGAPRSSPFSKSGKVTKDGPGSNNKKSLTTLSKPNHARNKHMNTNLTSELDSLLGDLNSQLQRKKTKRDARTGAADPDPASEAEKRLNEAQARHESLQNDMMSALDGISSLGK
ncbi:hypothetical protein BGZ99_009665 [Dissophora globulifera]|uniref:Uncharacterized protein n=1 Tax=Dissophora globulifera TaxID=979702 RepID=A0A9P6R7Y6_9FUNG|nr:hypothetical protein BGZ99_009665 [Dissophora globulifera]